MLIQPGPDGALVSGAAGYFFSPVGPIADRDGKRRRAWHWISAGTPASGVCTASLRG
ncbi:hypothetical protein [Rhodococcus koreensis]|uniref:hypothetical protein n=1 Tax=Rhodococcus koreensis TaxID=99653 RepID=UPI00197F4182|nr:hypothetical protein [Rhodococcus koreensis]QSE84809.1 hypothetical protein JWS14_39840 [Rhodococcus koreensis]